MCGEKFPKLHCPVCRLGSPPRVRGKADAAAHWLLAQGITPAYAGKRQGMTSSVHHPWDHPRVCGEKINRFTADYLMKGSPPRVRGKATNAGSSGRAAGITPAYAGKSCRAVRSRWRARDHPRVCREKYGRFDRRCSRAGSPPRVRGKEKHHPFLPEQHGITPACAGKRTFVPLVKSTA